MKRTLLTLTLLAVAAASLPALAEDTERRERRKGARGDHVRKMAEELGLSDEQKEQLKQVFQTHFQAVKNFREEHAEKAKGLRDQMKAARESGDKEKIKQVGEQMRELGKARMELAKNLDSQVADVLNAEQYAKYQRHAKKMRRRMHAAGDLRRAFGSEALGLTDEQKAKVREIFKANKGDMKAAVEKVKAEVLTEEQAAKFEEMAKRHARHHRRRRAGRALGLTDEQRKAMREIMRQTRKDVQAAEGAEAKKAVIEAAHKKILSDVLTSDEQREKFKEMTARMRERRRQRRSDGEGARGRGSSKGRGRRGDRERPGWDSE